MKLDRFSAQNVAADFFRSVPPGAAVEVVRVGDTIKLTCPKIIKPKRRRRKAVAKPKPVIERENDGSEEGRAENAERPREDGSDTSGDSVSLTDV